MNAKPCPICHEEPYYLLSYDGKSQYWLAIKCMFNHIPMVSRTINKEYKSIYYNPLIRKWNKEAKHGNL
jgi:hypothetical protein